MFNTIKNLIHSYKDYRKEVAQDTLKLRKAIEDHEIKIQKEADDLNTQDDMLLADKITFNENSGKYEFKITVEYNGKPHTFSCESELKDWCRKIAGFTLIRARWYQATGNCGED